MAKELKRSTKNKVIGGVCGGVAEYFDVDPIFVRLVTLLLIAASHLCMGLLVYVLAWIIIPVEEAHVPQKEGHDSDKS